MIDSYFTIYFPFRSDVLGQFMPLVGKDWNQTGVARLFSAIKVCILLYIPIKFIEMKVNGRRYFKGNSLKSILCLGKAFKFPLLLLPFHYVPVSTSSYHMSQIRGLNFQF
jgi:hypothetical protein